jgi:hypothetical protein
MTATRKPRARSERSVRLLDVEGQLVLQITMRTGRRAECVQYHLTRLPSDFGTAFELRKSACCGEEVYHVLLNGAESSCECKGHLRWGKCKHVSALARLLEMGRI